MDNSKHKITTEESYLNITYNLEVNINLLVSSETHIYYIIFCFVFVRRKGMLHVQE